MSQEEYKSFKLSGVIKKVLYKNEETKYIIAVLENNQKICGVYFDTDIEKIVGEEVILKGNWITHKKYGVQFEFDTLVLKEAEIFFFLTKIVKGVGKKFAHDLLEKYGEEGLIDILNNRPNELLDFKGIKKKKLEMIVSSWQKFQHLRELGSFLGKFGVTSNLITKIYSSLGEVENLIEVAQATMVSAATRSESRGAHAHDDYPKRDDAHFLHHTLAYYDPKEPIMKTHPVTITKYQPVERKY